MQSGIPIARCDIALRADRWTRSTSYKKTNYREAPTLFLEFHGIGASPSSNRRRRCRRSPRSTAARTSVWATKPEERTQLWEARHDAYFACLQLRPGSRAVSTDVCVPISRLAECVVETMADVKSYFAADAAASATSATATSTS